MSPSRGSGRHYNNIVFCRARTEPFLCRVSLCRFISSSTLPLRVREDANDDDDDEKEKGFSGHGGPPSGLSQWHPSALKGGYDP